MTFKKKPKLNLWLVLVVVIAFIFLGVIQHKDPKRDEAIAFTSFVKEMMKDPQSFEVIDLRISDNDSICLTYKAKNSFNAFLQGSAVKTNDGKMQIEGVSATEQFLWAGNCSHPSGRSVTF
jgi:hypothetical protein